MGVALPADSGGAKKSLDATINLVPFIDLLSSLIAFLLITAVWTQVNAMQAFAQTGGDTTVKEEPAVFIAVGKQGFQLSAPDGEQPFPVLTRTANDFDFEGLAAQLSALKERAPQLSRVTVQADDDVTYDVLIRIMDRCIGTGLVNVALAPSVGR